MSVGDVLAYALTAAALAALTLFGLRVWRAHPERVTTRGLAGTADLVALSALMAGYLLAMPQPFPARVGLVVYARMATIATLALARARRGARHQAQPKGRLMICQPCRDPHKTVDCIDTTAGREYPQGALRLRAPPSARPTRRRAPGGLRPPRHD